MLKLKSVLVSNFDYLLEIYQIIQKVEKDYARVSDAEIGLRKLAGRAGRKTA